MRTKFTIIILALLVGFIACEKGENDRNISKHGSDDSHYTGDNCMNCHYTQGRGEGYFSLAGSAFGLTDNATIYLTDAVTFDEAGQIEIDKLGNFHTTEPIDFSNGIIVDIAYGNNQFLSMERVIYTGACNLCHNSECFADLGDPCFEKITLE